MAGYDILLLDGSAPVFKSLAWVLAYKGHQVVRAAPAEVCLEALQGKEFDLIIAQLVLHPLDELEVLKKAKELNPQALVIVLSGEDEPAFPLEAYRMEIDDYLLMPCSQAQIWRRVSACLDRLAPKHLDTSSKKKLAVINQRALKKWLYMLNYIRHALDSLGGDLSLVNQGVHGKIEESLRHKMQKAAARIEVLMEVTEGFQREISWH